MAWNNREKSLQITHRNSNIQQTWRTFIVLTERQASKNLYSTVQISLVLSQLTFTSYFILTLNKTALSISLLMYMTIFACTESNDTPKSYFFKKSTLSHAKQQLIPSSSKYLLSIY